MPATMTKAVAFYLAGEAKTSEQLHAVLAKHDDLLIAEVSLANRDDVDRAIASCVAARRSMRELPMHARRSILLHTARRLCERKNDIAMMLAREVGKTVKEAKGEIVRAIETFTLAAEECSRLTGEFARADASPRAEGYFSITKRVPIGACSLIVPFNFPINLAAHKVAPAIAAGCPFVLKPDTDCPLAVLMLAEILAETDLPRGAWSVMPMDDEARTLMSEDERFNLLTFTGSPKVGWALKATAGRKKVVLELGGNAACIVHEDADLDRAVDRLMIGGFAVAGQSCISVQRILAHRSIYNDLRDRLARRVRALNVGDPLDDDTDIGPLFHKNACDRIEAWLTDATKAGATVLVGGKARKPFFEPTIVENVPHDASLSCQEVFGPLVTLEPYDDFDDALRIADDSEYGLQAGVFTSDIGRILKAFDELEVGGLVVNDPPTMRIDAQPYGGTKKSGIGREGVRYAIEDMTEIRHLLLRA